MVDSEFNFAALRAWTLIILCLIELCLILAFLDTKRWAKKNPNGETPYPIEEDEWEDDPYFHPIKKQ